MSRVFFTADSHFFFRHRERKRDFMSTEAMNRAMIVRWNRVVGPDDTVYHLGDFAHFHRRKEKVGDARGIVSQLNGYVYLIRGNHDSLFTATMAGFVSVDWYRVVEIEGQEIHLSHSPFARWPGDNRGSWNIHGHCHGKLPPKPGQYDAFVKTHDYAPVPFEVIRERLSRRASKID